MRQVNGNPTKNKNLAPTTFRTAATVASGLISGSGGVDLSVLNTGDSFILSLDGGSAQGFTHAQEYWVASSTASGVKISNSKSGSMKGTIDSNGSGNAGAGYIYPNYHVGGTLAVNTAGNLYIRGTDNPNRGWTSFSLQTTAVNGDLLPYMIKDVATSGLTASGLVSWHD